MLTGRTTECAAIDRLVVGARTGAGGALILRGPAGIGKSALCEYAVATAQDAFVSRVTGVESEVALGFAALHQLLAPFVDRVGELPRPQRHAIESVLGLADHGPSDPLLVFLAVLTLLDVAARQQPLVLVIDDAQWVDDESARVLTFVARRLQAEAIAMLFAVRDSSMTDSRRFHGLPQLDVRGLLEPDAMDLLARLVDAPVDPGVVHRLVTETDGNPLALVELARELSRDELRGLAPLPDPLPIGASLQEQFGGLARQLPPPARELLLLASAERLGDPALLARAAAALSVSWDQAVAGIETAELASFGTSVVFRHPLIRSGVYHGATPTERRRVHRALADVLDGADDADRGAWHLAAAAVSQDEDVARALERAAERALGRGGMQVAAEFLVRSSELTPDPTRRIDRLLDAARLRAAAGDAGRAQPLLNAVLAQAHDGHHRAEADWTQGLIWLSQGRGRDAVRALARAVAAIEQFDRDVAFDALVTAADAVLYAESLVDASAADDIARAALRWLPSDNALAPTASLLRGVARWITDGEAAVPLLGDALNAMRTQINDTDELPTARDPSTHLLLAANAAFAVLDDAALHTITRRWVEGSRRVGNLTMLPVALDLSSVADILAGRFDSAAAALAEADDILSFAGSRGLIGESGVGGLILSAYRGDDERTREVAYRRTHDARERGSGVDLAHSDYALAVLEVSNGRYETALDHCRAIDEHASFALSALAFPLLVEAAVRADEPALALAAIERLSPRFAASDSGWAQGILHCAGALVAADNDADACYRAALDHLARSTASLDLARTQLLYGEWLRRQRLRREARRPLRAALQFFETVGADAFAQRARLELAATGEAARPRTAAARDLLTPQESQIAHLVAAGTTNAEIASRMFISTSTVEYHLRKIYRKLEVRSRTQLARLELLG